MALVKDCLVQVLRILLQINLLGSSCKRHKLYFGYVTYTVPPFVRFHTRIVNNPDKYQRQQACNTFFLF